MCRKGETHGLFDLEAKSMSMGSNPDGGYLVPTETETEIGRRLSAASPIRAIAGIRQVSTSVYKKPFAITGAATGWVGETAARPETAAPTLAELQFPAMELYAMPAATQALLDDAAVNLDQWIADEVQQAFADQESTAFVTGNGTNKPKGFLAYTNVADASWTWGNLGYIATGTAGAFPASNPSDKLIDLAYALKSGYRQNAHLVMNRKTQSVIRKFKDVDGNYLWQPAATADGKASLMNFPIAESEDMPDIATDSYSLAFGDFNRGYLIVDRVGVQRPARSLQRQALCAVLHHQARRRRRAELRGDQADEVRRVVRVRIANRRMANAGSVSAIRHSLVATRPLRNSHAIHSHLPSSARARDARRGQGPFAHRP